MRPFFWVVLAAAAALLAGSGYFWLRARRPPKGESAYHFKCPTCGQRFRYQAKQAGHKGQCPRCLKHLNFPCGPS
jgi:hypothetical protein